MISLQPQAVTVTYDIKVIIGLSWKRHKKFSLQTTNGLSAIEYMFSDLE